MLRPAMLLSLLACLAAPVGASTYSAQLAAPARGHIVVRDINWACAGLSCEGATQESRPAVLCEALAKRAGRIDSFLVDGRPLSAAELDKCNIGAKAGAASAAAAQ